MHLLIFLSHPGNKKSNLSNENTGVVSDMILRLLIVISRKSMRTFTQALDGKEEEVLEWKNTSNISTSVKDAWL